MNAKAMSLKAKIKNYAIKNNIAAQVVLQNFMFERFLARLSRSKYSQMFVIKGGMLIASLVGIDTRATMDLDATLRNLPLKKEEIEKAVREICAQHLDDDVRFEIKSIECIRKDDVYGGYCVKMQAFYETIVTPLSLDISTGDIITPAAVPYEFIGMFDNSIRIKLWVYNIETVMDEKLEAIFSRGVFSTRPRDYYDIFILEKTQEYDSDLVREAFIATAKHRGSYERIADTKSIVKILKNNTDLHAMWNKYQKKFNYAADISFSQTIEAINHLTECLYVNND